MSQLTPMEKCHVRALVKAPTIVYGHCSQNSSCILCAAPTIQLYSKCQRMVIKNLDVTQYEVLFH